MENPINNTIFDSRDLMEYRDYLAEELVNAWNEENPDHEASDIDDIFGTKGYEYVAETADAFSDFASIYESEMEHYGNINDFCLELEGYGDFKYGESIIHENHFTEYTEELCKDLGFIAKDFPSWIEIDWEGTADNVKQDYTSAMFEGETYYMRA